MYFRESGYSFSSMDLLNRGVSIFGRSSARSFMTAGLILYMSLALFGLIFRMYVVMFSCVMCLSLNCGVSGFCSLCSSP